MSTYREVELRCDGIPGDPFGCSDTIFDYTGHQARKVARERGWLVSQSGGKDYCPEHRQSAGEAS